MSRVRSDKFTNRAATGPCSFTHGIHAIEATGVGIGVSLGYGGLVAVGATISGNLSVGGTLTYEDVQNVDSTGLITARSGIKVGQPTGVGATFNPAGDLVVAGVVTAATFSGSATGLSGTPNITVGFATVTGFDSNALLREKCNVTAGKLSDNQTINLDNGMVHLFTTAESTVAVPNIMSTVGINTQMGVGDAICVTLVTTANANGYITNIQIDGAAVTENWCGGSTPSDGGSSGVDINAFNIIKTASETFTVIGNQTKTS